MGERVKQVARRYWPVWVVDVAIGLVIGWHGEQLGIVATVVALASVGILSGLIDWPRLWAGPETRA